MRNPRFRVLFSIISIIVMFTLLYDSSLAEKRSVRSMFHVYRVKLKHRRNMQELHETSSDDKGIKLMDLQVCPEFYEHEGYKNKCDYLIANPDCTSDGFFNYIKFFYCNCQNYSFLGYFVLGSWLVVLFYLLGSTASNYFCCSLETFSNLLKMSPTIAGVTLLPLGNGASDVFASIAAFMGTGSGDVGLNGVLGADVFITCIVVGVVCLSIAKKKVQIDKKCFIRDVCFLLFTISCLTLIIVIGKVTLLGAIAFLSIYVCYVVFVAFTEVWRKKGSVSKSDSFDLFLPLVGNPISDENEWDEEEQSKAPLVGPNPSDLPDSICMNNLRLPVWGWFNEEQQSKFSFSNLCWLLEMPLNVPRRLTIPIIEEDRWSKMYAIASAFLAPVLLAFLWNTRENTDPFSGKIAYFIGSGTGFILSVLASVYTKTDHPPRRFLFPWIIGGFFMSIIWFYIVADELVSLLVSLGTILGINPSMLALTILAWGNSMNDLMSNSSFAMNDSKGVQIAMSGCYAGPMFNTLIGLGVSLVLGAWSTGSEPYLVPQDAGLFLTIGFLTAGLIYALIVLPQNDMRPNKVLGIGLIVIYVVFLSIRISMAVGFGSLDSL
ncbi:cation/calcium exchanger 4-like [Silene latifolia]|uniref:cation/calcium exchanger 4-like n=1 Tax=Silene latifolia TaxID=37657 RepID=UPI003D786EF3